MDRGLESYEIRLLILLSASWGGHIPTAGAESLGDHGHPSPSLDHLSCVTFQGSWFFHSSSGLQRSMSREAETELRGEPYRLCGPSLGARSVLSTPRVCWKGSPSEPTVKETTRLYLLMAGKLKDVWPRVEPLQVGRSGWCGEVCGATKKSWAVAGSPGLPRVSTLPWLYTLVWGNWNY